MSDAWIQLVTFVVEYEIAVVFALLFTAVLSGLTLLLISETPGWQHRPITRWCFVLCPLGIVLIVLQLVINSTETGSWRQAVKRDTTALYLEFARAFPSSPHRGNVVTRLRALQDELLRSAGHSPVTTVMRELRAQQFIPGRAQVMIAGPGNFFWDGESDGRYRRKLAAFDSEIVSSIAALLADFSAEIALTRPTAPPYPTPTLVVHYTASPGAAYEYCCRGPAPYRFNAIELSGDWLVFLSGALEPVHVGSAGKIRPLAVPKWDAPKYPEDGIADIVTTEFLKRMVADLRREKSQSPQ